MKVFTEFAVAASLHVDSGTPGNEKPPLPDISCSIGGQPYLFELREITDEGLAGEIGRSLRSAADGEGGFLSEEEPLGRMISKKAASTYETGGVPLHLVLHYDKQYPFAPVEYLHRSRIGDRCGFGAHRAVFPDLDLRRLEQDHPLGAVLNRSLP
jgi:hypothetical protein